MFFLKPVELNFPGGTVDKNLSTNEEDIGSIPGPGRFHMPWGSSAHAPQLLKPIILEPVSHNKRSQRVGKPVHCQKSSPSSLQLEKAHVQQQRPSTAQSNFFTKICRMHIKSDY